MLLDTQTSQQAIDLEAVLIQFNHRGALSAEQFVCVGTQVRLIMVRLSAALAARQRAAHKEKSAIHGRTASEKNLALCDWWLLITNVPAELLNPAEAANLYGARWQIELMFKRWKSQLGS